MVISINGREYKAKQTLRALMIFEDAFGRLPKNGSFADGMRLYYSILLANNPDMDLEFDEFISAVDSNPSIMKDFQKVVEDKSKPIADGEKKKTRKKAVVKG